VEQGIIQPAPSAAFVMQHADHGYSVNLPLAVVLQQNFLMATHFDGEPLTPEHGFPVRGVVGAVPGRNDLTTPYLWKGAKWLQGLEFMTADRPGFWERAGYSNSADVWKEERYA
jgi:DMSO/TMAO reductase YedYZ molybdopterin-dependent catalytic subunit